MGVKVADARPLICGRVIKTSPSRIYFSAGGIYGGLYSKELGPWSTTYLKGCGFDGTSVIISEPGKYAFTFRMGISGGSFNDVLFTLRDADSYWRLVGVGGGWSQIKGSVRARNIGSCAFINWSAIGNMDAGRILTPMLWIRSGATAGMWANPVIDQPRAPVFEWFRISENIGERSVAAWYW